MPELDDIELERYELRGGPAYHFTPDRRDFFKFAVRGQVSDIVAAIVQVVAALAHGADCSFACRGARQRHRLLGFEWCGRVIRVVNTHFSTPDLSPKEQEGCG